MKNKVVFASLTILLGAILAFGSVPAFAGTTVYDNGLPNYNDAWTINYGYSVADSFRLSAGTTVNHIDFWVVLFPGSNLQTVDWSIFTLGPRGSRIWGRGTATTTLESVCWWYTCDYEYGITFPAISLPAGTYWINFSNAVTSDQSPAYWEESGGPSSAYENAVGTIPSEAFDVVSPAFGRIDAPNSGKDRLPAPDKSAVSPSLRNGQSK